MSSLQNIAAAIPSCGDKTNLHLSILCVLLKLLGVSYAVSLIKFTHMLMLNVDLLKIGIR
jgi:hypothetical protein